MTERTKLPKVLQPVASSVGAFKELNATERNEIIADLRQDVGENKGALAFLDALEAVNRALPETDQAPASLKGARKQQTNTLERN